jgi:hypothetical protein
MNISQLIHSDDKKENTSHQRQSQSISQPALVSSAVSELSFQTPRASTMPIAASTTNQSEKSTGKASARHCEPAQNIYATIKQQRAPRPKYTTEQMHFIWYHRIDLDEHWEECLKAFNIQFSEKATREYIQRKLYRFIKKKKCPTVREQQRFPMYGVIFWCRVWYPWMKINNQEAEQMLQKYAAMESYKEELNKLRSITEIIRGYQIRESQTI